MLSGVKEIGDVDAIIIPGTRNTILDAIALKESGKAKEIIELSKKIPIVGICGGYQILGEKIYDESKKESSIGTIEGLGLFFFQNPPALFGPDYRPNELQPQFLQESDS